MNCLRQDRIYSDSDLLPAIANDLQEIRTYNYLENNVIDRRLDRHFNLDEVILGSLGEIIQGCLDRDIRSRLVKSIHGDS